MSRCRTRTAPSRGGHRSPDRVDDQMGGCAARSHAQRRFHRTGHEPAARARRRLAGRVRAGADGRTTRSASRAAGRRRRRRRGRRVRAHATRTSPARGRHRGPRGRRERRARPDARHRPHAGGARARRPGRRRRGNRDRPRRPRAGARRARHAGAAGGARARRARRRVLPRDARHPARRGARLRAIPLGRHRSTGRLELDARARRDRSAARHPALRVDAGKRAARHGDCPRRRARRPGRARRARPRTCDPRHVSRRTRVERGPAGRLPSPGNADARAWRVLGGRQPPVLPRAHGRSPRARLGRRRVQPAAVADRSRRALARSLDAARVLARAGDHGPDLAATAAAQRCRGAQRRRGRACRGRAPLAHGRADGPLQPPPHARCDRGRARPLRAHGRSPERGDARSRPLQAHQRRLRARGGRPRAERGRAPAARPAARIRRARPLGRRGVHRSRAGHPRRRDPAHPGGADSPARGRSAAGHR